MPLPVCRFSRGGFCKGSRGQAAFGYDPVQEQAYYGFRLHPRTSVDGAVLAYELAPADAIGLAVLPEPAPPQGTTSFPTTPQAVGGSPPLHASNIDSPSIR
jgi:hypothetical protein